MCVALKQGTDKEGRGVFIEKGDVRAKRMARKAGSLIIFIVDASGSMALNRMNAAKGAAMSLLQTAYQSRDKICIIPFQASDPRLSTPRSVVLAEQQSFSLPMTLVDLTWHSDGFIRTVLA